MMIPIQPNKEYMLIDPDADVQTVTTVEPYGMASYVIAKVKRTGHLIPLYPKSGRSGQIWRIKEDVEYKIHVDGKINIVVMNFALDRYLIPLEDDNFKKELSESKPVERPKEVVLI